ncbi:hypothetical protein ABT369_22625 [Dactylosporangium sp. NPDC000244]|uniref:hypothetical protein n=1 Tax=Dactylosporangium sp. NPDC000244 TaxID=3154365 RepID=UPI00331E4B07
MAVDAPLRQLAHRTGSGESAGGSWNTYALYPVAAPRPATGRSRAELTCPECGGTVAFTIASPGIARRRRGWWRAVAAGPVALAPVLFLPAAAAATTSQAVTLAVLGVALLPVLGAGAYVAWRRAREEDGLRLRRADGTHSLRPAGATSDFSAALEP